MRIVVFSGGRGAASISRSLAAFDQVDLTVLVNAYDDGLSTGLVRKLIPGMLGPSDVRKNFSSLLATKGIAGSRISTLLEYRIKPSSFSEDDWAADEPNSAGRFLEVHCQHISVRQSESVRRWISQALTVVDELNPHLDSNWLADMSVGNLLFMGAYVECDREFNRTIELWHDVFDLGRHKIVNVTKGENRVLVGIKEDGTFLPDEAAIVDKQSPANIERVFLVENYLSPNELGEIGALDRHEAIRYLEERESLPHVSATAQTEIENADLIVYGPGTQHSSLFPTYMTVGLAEEISKRTNIEKIFVSNLNADHDIQSEDIKSLLMKATFYMNIGSEGSFATSDLITQCFVNTNNEDHFPWGVTKVTEDDSSVGMHFAQWSDDGVRHNGERISRGLLSLGMAASEENPLSGYHCVSIIVPVLNEVERLSIVLVNLMMFDWLQHNLVPEIIVVDGGSTDGSTEVSNSFPTARLIEMKPGTGRGSALTSGIRSANGDFVIIFPSDNEYDVSDIPAVVNSLISGQSPIVFGSRTGLCADTDSRLREIYGGRTKAYFQSKWGGFMLSLLSGVIYKRWLADTLTTVKGFDRTAIETLSFSGKSIDWDMRIICDASRLGIPIAEIPVRYRPRRIDQGKKITAAGGLSALLTLLFGKIKRSI